MDKYTLRQNIADYTCKHFFDGKMSLKGKIIKDLAALDSDTLMDYNIILKNQEDYILDVLHKMDRKSSFNSPYGRFKYLHGMVQRLIKESKVESAKPNFQAQQEPPQASIQKRPAWMDELETESKLSKVEQPNKRLTYAQRQNLKNFPDGDIPVITDTDLFEPDPIHEAWAKLSADQRRKNREKAIAEHRQSHPPKVYSDEIY